MFDCYCAVISYFSSFFFITNALFFVDINSVTYKMSLLFFVSLYWLGVGIFIINEKRHLKKETIIPILFGIIINTFIFLGLPKIIAFIQQIDSSYKANFSSQQIHNFIILLYGVVLIFLCLLNFIKYTKTKISSDHNFLTLLKLLALFTLYGIWICSCIFYLFGLLNDIEITIYNKINILVFNSSKFSIETLYSTYGSILIGAVALYFTILAFIKPKQMTLSNYVKYLIAPNEKVLYFSILPIFIINTLLIFFNKDNTFYRIALVDSIFMILIYLINGIYKFSYLENNQIASEIFVKKVCNEIKKENTKQHFDNNIVINLFYEYLNPCFPGNSFNVAFKDYESIINKIVKEEDRPQMVLDFTSKSISVFKDFNENQLKIIMVNEVKANQIVYVMKRIIDSNIKFILKNYNNNQEKYFEEILTTCSKLYEIWFSLYRELICTGYNNLRYSMLLEGVEPLSYGLIFIENDNKSISQKYEELFKYVIFKSYEISILILHQSDFITFRNFLQDYIRITQFMTYKDSCYDLIRYQNYYLIVIGTYIANLFEEKRINEEYLRFLPFIIEEVNAIEIGLQTVLYTKLLDLTGFHDNPKTFLYYLILLIIYSLPQIPDNEAEKWLDNIISKIKISGEKYNIYETILNTIDENINVDNKYKNEVELLKNKLNVSKDKYNESKRNAILELLKKSLNSKRMHECRKRDLDRFNDHFSYCQIYKNEHFKKIMLPKGFSFVHSGEYITGKSSNDIFGIYDQFRIIDSFIFNEYINLSIVTNVSTVDEIIKNTENNEITLICARKYYMYLHTLKNIQYEGPDCIRYNGKIIKFIFDRNVSDYILIKNNLIDSIFVQPMEEKSLEPKIENEDKIPNVSIPYEPSFYINTKSNIRVYSIIGVKDI